MNNPAPRCPESYRLPFVLDANTPTWVRDARGFYVANAATVELAAFIAAAANAAVEKEATSLTYSQIVAMGMRNANAPEKKDKTHDRG